MLRNYLRIAFRNLRRNLGYTAINLTGLAIGIAACFLIALYVRHEPGASRRGRTQQT